jgi:nucleoside-diphosphate-sugar epimerase
MKIFITGGTGFIGENLVNKLLERNHEIYVLCRNVTDRKITLPQGTNIVYGDLIDGHFLKKSLKEINPDVVVHLASVSSVAYGHQHAQENFEITFLGTVNIQKACEGLSNLQKFIFAGTSEEYGNQTQFPIKENAPLFPNQPYAIAKVASDYYLDYCKIANGFPSVILRPFNTYGRTKNFTFVTESIIYQMLTKDKVILGNPDATRDLLYVDDHVNGYIKAIETTKDLEKCRAINLCTGIGTSIKTLAEKIQKIADFKGEIIWNIKIRPTEINKLVGDWGPAFDYLEWRPQTSLDEGLSLATYKIKSLVVK